MAWLITHTREQVKPDEVYNLAAQSHVKVSFEMAEYALDLCLLLAVRTCFKSMDPNAL